MNEEVKKITIEYCPKHKEWYSQNCSNCMAEDIDIEHREELRQAVEQAYEQCQERVERIKGEIGKGLAGLDLEHREYYAKRDFAVIPVETWKAIWDKELK